MKIVPSAVETSTIHRRMPPTAVPFEGRRGEDRPDRGPAIDRHNAAAYAWLRLVPRLQPCAATGRHLGLFTDDQPPAGPGTGGTPRTPQQEPTGADRGITFRLFVEIDMKEPGTCPSATITRMAHTLTNIDSVYGI
ncbi:hypothetical protein AB0N09_06530 [Streptomyces erythrochromogenes]|uniref:hypothetical protein n=1 Tax=Streptomyces erythrochromogenes TaxID=285574 RepID=UPI00342658C5